jgi:hypothetical protein
MFRSDAPAAGRRPVMPVMMTVALALIGGLLYATAARTQAAPAPQATPAPNQRTFGHGGAMWLNFVKADKTADFEFVMTKVKEALQKSEKPERKQQAAGWKVFKSPDAAAGGNVLYVFLIDPVLKGADYQISNIITEGFGNTAETNDILKKYAESYPPTGAMSIANLNVLQEFGK